MPLTPRQCVEVFHLAFLRALVARAEDRSHFALKGGCNLRFFFGSIRYSEGMDLDVTVASKETLRNKVDRLLAAPVVTLPLRALGIEVVEVTAPKQTETTQRWKAGLRIGAATVRTKIEFSRRPALGGESFEAVNRALLTPYSLTPFLATHYLAPTAVAQKIQALAGRPEPQARDVFDLSHLFARLAEDASLPGVGPTLASRAIESAMSISYDDYASQVVAYLEPDQAAPLEDRSVWDAMQADVVARLEDLA